ncbi:MAG: hypothetical protein PHE88_11755 [Elusimicrobia bacterium]|nr:hypothetical protein [Elusimicrobiota bacterium]
MSFAKDCRERLIMMKEGGVKTFTCYDLLSKHATNRELRAIHSYISDRCENGELAPIMEHGQPKKIRPSFVPEWIQSKTMVRVYEFKTFGEKVRHNQKPSEPITLSKAAKKVAVSKFQDAWQGVWPELFKNPHKGKLKISAYQKGV